MTSQSLFLFVFFFNDTATTEIYTLSLHDALPICLDDLQAIRLGERVFRGLHVAHGLDRRHEHPVIETMRDRKSTRLNSSHLVISYAVFCLKKKKAYPLGDRLRFVRPISANHFLRF